MKKNHGVWTKCRFGLDKKNNACWGECRVGLKRKIMGFGRSVDLNLIRKKLMLMGV